MIFVEEGVYVRTFYSGWLDENQIRVIENGKNDYTVKSGKKSLTKREAMGAIVRFILEKNIKLPPP